MNKISLALIGLGAVAFAGCSQDDQFLASQNGEYTGVVEQGVASRSYSNVNGAFKWAAGDDIAAWITNGGDALGFKTMKMVGGAGTDKASYGAVVGGKPTDVAVFPVSAAKSYDNGVLTVNYPSVYDNYCTDYNKDSMSVSDPMAAFFAKGEKQFLFRHVGGVIEWDIDVPAYVDEFTVKMNSGVTGDFAVDATDKGNPYVSARENTVDSVSFKFELTTESTEIHFYMPVPVGTYKGCTIYIKNNGNVVDSFTSTAENTVRRCDWIVMPLISMGYTGVIENAVTAWAGLRQVAKNGGVVSLGSDIIIKEDTNVVVGAGKSLVVDLNGKKIENTNDLWDESRYQWSLFSAQGGTLVLKGDGTVKAKENDCYAVDVQDGGHLVIEGGHYIGNCHAVYVYEGTAEIKGGVFEVQQKYSDASKADEFVLNCYDANRRNGTAKIVVKGGTFVGFNPGDCYAEGAHTNFLAPGYVSVKTKVNGKDAWTVKKCAIVSDKGECFDDLATAIQSVESGATLFLNKGEYSTGLTEQTGIYKNITITAATGVSNKDVVIKGGFFTNSGDASKAHTINIKNVTLDNADAARRANIASPTIMSYGNCTYNIENVIFTTSNTNKDATIMATYWTGVESGSAKAVYNVKNCVFNCDGRRPIQFYGNTTATFDNCTFHNPYRYVAAVHGGGNVVTWRNITVTNNDAAGKSYYNIIEVGTNEASYEGGSVPDRIIVGGTNNYPQTVNGKPVYPYAYAKDAVKKDQVIEGASFSK